MTFVAAMFIGIKLWMASGAVVAFALLVRGIDKIDEDARGSYPFRLLLVPGIVLLWPLVLYRWSEMEKNNSEIGLDSFKPPRKNHGVFAILIAVAVVVIILTAVQVKQSEPENYIPRKLSMEIGERRIV